MLYERKAELSSRNNNCRVISRHRMSWRVLKKKKKSVCVLEKKKFISRPTFSQDLNSKTIRSKFRRIWHMFTECLVFRITHCVMGSAFKWLGSWHRRCAQAQPSNNCLKRSNFALVRQSDWRKSKHFHIRNMSTFDLFRGTKGRILRDDFPLKKANPKVSITYAEEGRGGGGEGVQRNREFCVRRNYSKCLELVAQKRLFNAIMENETRLSFYGIPHKPENHLWMDENEDDQIEASSSSDRCLERRKKKGLIYFNFNSPAAVDTLQKKSALTATYSCYVDTAFSKAMVCVRAKHPALGTGTTYLLRIAPVHRQPRLRCLAQRSKLPCHHPHATESKLVPMQLLAFSDIEAETVRAKFAWIHAM